MSNVGTARPPQTDAEWARDVQQRLASLENKSTVRLGEWVLSSRDGELIGSRNGETVNLVTSDGVDEEGVLDVVRSSGRWATSTDLAATNQTVSEQGGLISGALTDILSLFDNFGSQQAEIEAVITRLDEVEAASAVTPAYAADVNDMPTCSRDDLVRWSLSGGVSSASLGSHSHSFNSTTNSVGSTNLGSHSHNDTLSVSIVPATYQPAVVNLSSVAPVDYTPIIVDRKGKVRLLRWRVGGDATWFGVDAYYMALCIYNPSNGNIEKVWDSGDIKDGVANTSSLREVSIDMGLDQYCIPGQILFVAHQQIAPGLAQGARAFGCKPQPSNQTARPGQLLDSWYYRSGNQSSIPSSISLASLNRRNDCIPWAAVSVDSTA